MVLLGILLSLPAVREVREVSELSDSVLDAHMPVVVRGGIKHWGAAGWTLAGLKQMMQKQTIWLTDFYARGEDEKALDDHLDSSIANEFIDTLINADADGPGQKKNQSYGADLMAIRESPDILQQNPELLDQLDFEGTLAAPNMWEKNMWMGPAGMVTALHADVVPMSILAHMIGEKQIWLYPPEQGK